MRVCGNVIAALLCGWGVSLSAGELYDRECCPQTDCHPAQPGAVRQTDDGYVIPELGETIPAGDARVRLSADARFHICARSSANPDMSWSQIYVMRRQRELKCLYVPALF